ncbi:UNVERIFIED_ORG: maltose phosphorylase/glycosyl hydrolase/vacuolar acid trehalase domain protein, partial [Clostridioides difficile Y384]
MVNPLLLQILYLKNYHFELLFVVPHHTADTF